VRLHILPLRFADKNLLISLMFVLESSFKIPVVISSNSFSLDGGMDLLREQYNSTWILTELLKSEPEESCRILGVTSVDLFIPVLTYVFGEAQLDGKAAVVSIYRLRDELYGLPKNPEKLKTRLGKEAVHELGHTFGLVHCQDPGCVMYTSTYAEEIDFKSKEFCSSCSFLLEKKKEDLQKRDKTTPES
jgi:archaemetzincin